MAALADSEDSALQDTDLLPCKTWTLELYVFPGLYWDPVNTVHHRTVFLDCSTEAGDNMPQILSERAAARLKIRTRGTLGVCGYSLLGKKGSAGYRGEEGLQAQVL